MRFDPLGWCWLLGICNWWNPPEYLLFEVLGKNINFCIKCWNFEERGDI